MRLEKVKHNFSEFFSTLQEMLTCPFKEEQCSQQLFYKPYFCVS